MSNPETPSWKDYQEFSDSQKPEYDPSGKSNGVGEQVGKNTASESENSSDKKDPLKQKEPSITPEQYKENNAENSRLVAAELEKNPDWPPAKGNPEAEEELSQNLEAGLNTSL